MKKNLMRIVILVICVLGFSHCDKYVPPSPMDGMWRVTSVDGSDASSALEDQEAVYLKILNVLFQINYSKKYNHGLSRYTWGYIEVHRDRLYFIRDKKEKVKSWPYMGKNQSDTLKMKYKVWKKSLTLYHDDVTIHLERH